eukprot:GHVT01006043.1.p2 GENE.GHVT01006043.1~~GHVT01006043.1.p2  ORF type:complete len:108 (-),score=14.42 GHVT01006043.1:1155-1478(-)
MPKLPSLWQRTVHWFGLRVLHWFGVCLRCQSYTLAENVLRQHPDEWLAYTAAAAVGVTVTTAMTTAGQAAFSFGARAPTSILLYLDKLFAHPKLIANLLWSGTVGGV